MKKMLTQIRAMSLIAFMTILSFNLWADVEPNNTLATANPLALNTNVIGTLGTPVTDTEDWYAITLPNVGSVTVNGTYGTGLNGYFYFYRPNGSLINYSSAGTGPKTLTADCYGANIIYLRCTNTSGAGSYNLQVTLNAPPVPADIEPNNSIALIQQTFTEGQSFTGHLGHNNNGTTDSDEYFYYISPRDGNVTFSVTTTTGLNVWVYLYRKNGNLLGYSSNGSGLREFTATCQAADTLIGRINGSSGCGSYTAAFNTSTLPYLGDVEPNNSIATIKQTFQENQSFTGHLNYANGLNVSDNDDYFYYISPRNGNVTFSVTADAGLNVWVYLYRKNGQLMGYSSNGSGLRQYTANCQAADTLIGRINGSSGCGSYTAVFNTSTPQFANDVETNNSIADATFTSVTKYNQGQLGYRTGNNIEDADDYYAIKITEVPFQLSVPFIYSGSLAGYIYLYNSTGSLINYLYNPGDTIVYNRLITSPGIYYLRFNATSGCGGYRFGTPCESGGDVDQDNICDANDSCLANGGLIKVVSGSTSTCLGDNFGDVIQVSVTGKYGQGTFGLVTFPALDVVALNSAGTFDLGLYPAGSYRIAYVGTPSLALLQGVTNANQLTGCYDLSNFIAVNSVLLNPGTISANSSTTVCGNDGVPSVISFTSTGAEGPSYRWAVLDQSGATVLANNTSGSFDFDTFGPGSYRVTRAVYSGLNPATVDPLNLPACIRRSNLITINVTSCNGPAALMSQPNPTTGLSTVIFTLPESGRATLEVYDMSGRMIQSLFNQDVQPDQEYRMDFQADGLPNGVYIYRLTSAVGVNTEKFILAR